MSQTVKVPIADIRSFKKNAAHVKSRGIIPVLDYIKFDNGEIVKTNTADYVVQQSNFSGSFLIQERELFSFVEFSSATDVSFTVEKIDKDKRRITMADGTRKAVSTSEDIGLYPVCAEPEGETFILSKDVLSAIGDAAKFTMEAEYDMIRPFVFVGNRVVTGSDGFIVFMKEFDFDLPVIVLHRDNAPVISHFESLTFSQSDTMMFFQSGSTAYGFRKSEAPHTDMRIFFKHEKKNKFSINKTDLISYNDWCVSRAPLKYACPEIEIKDGGLMVTMNDTGYELDGEEIIPITGSMEGKFKYNAALLSRLLKTAPDQEVTFHQSKGLFYITGESGFNSLIMQFK